jgi:hypothetical protein
VASEGSGERSVPKVYVRQNQGVTLACVSVESKKVGVERRRVRVCVCMYGKGWWI